MPAEEKGDFSFSSCLTATERSYWGGLMTAPFFLCRAPFEKQQRRGVTEYDKTHESTR